MIWTVFKPSEKTDFHMWKQNSGKINKHTIYHLCWWAWFWVDGVWSHLRDTALGIYKTGFSEWLKQGGKIYTQSSWGRVLGWIKKRKELAEWTLILTVLGPSRYKQATVLLPACLPCHDALALQTLNLSRPSILKSLLYCVLLQQWTK